MPTMTCPHCGYEWESAARSQKSRCGQCRSTVYVPASVRNVNGSTVAPNARAPLGRETVSHAPSAPSPAADPEHDEERAVHLTMPCCGRPMTLGLDDDHDTSRLRLRCVCGTAWTISDLLGAVNPGTARSEHREPRRPTRPVAPAYFAGVISPSAASELDHYRPGALG